MRNALLGMAAVMLAIGCGKSEDAASEAAEPVAVEAAPGTQGLTDEVACGAASGDAWEVFGVLDDKKDPFLNMRQKGSTKSEIVAKLTEGTSVKLVESKKKWRQVKVTAGDHAGKEGWVHECCIKPKGSLDRYYAVLSNADHKNSSGKALRSAASILRQDRANVHRFDKRDRRDRDDELYDDGKKRAFLEKAARECMSDEVSKAILKRTAEVWVTTYPGWVDVQLAKKGSKLKKGKQKVLTPWECRQRYCKCVEGDGQGTCYEDKMIRCIEKTGHAGYGCGAG